MRIIFSFVFIFLFLVLEAQEKVTFLAEDGLKITADLYETNPSNPYILLFHQAGNSRGEYRLTANKILKFGYNCLAVDLRSGGEVNYIQNHTALLAVQQDYPVDYLSSQKDIEAAINWVKERSKKQIVLFGSSFSASVCLIVAKNNPDIKAVIAFSPGEYFTPERTIQSEIKDFDKPVFAASSQRENSYVDQLLSEVPSENKIIFAPKTGGEHGSKSLWESNPNSQEYWLALTMFFSKIK
ncbi:MAG: dienelactone hydrolase family protein [Bacteroidales bacterium]|jgi:pimeloyl-ACP methyl ester carboxylesterase|nr:dienelactone hydrolase family protein [Bacteroidales bacterium]